MRVRRSLLSANLGVVLKADYDSEGDTIQIELAEFQRPAYGEDVENGAVVVSVHDDRPVKLDVIGTRRRDFEKPLRAAAALYELDAETLIAIARAAVAAPDRPVHLDVGAHTAV
jgi:hypothetical protein